MRPWWSVVCLCVACSGAGDASESSSQVEATPPPSVATRQAAPTATETESAASEAPARVSLSLQRLPLSELPAVATGVGLELSVPPDLAEIPITAQTDVPVSPSEARWVLRVALEAVGVAVYPSGALSRVSTRPARPSITRVARVRQQDAAEVGRLTERTWRGRLKVRWEGSLVAVSGPRAEVEEAVGRLYEKDRVAREVLGGG